MKKSPLYYGIKGVLEDYVREACLACVCLLEKWSIVSYSDSTGHIIPKMLSHSISRNAI